MERRHSAAVGQDGADPPSPKRMAVKEHIYDAPDRRAAFERYMEHADESFRSDLFAERPRQVLLLTIGIAIFSYLALHNVGDESGQPISRSSAQQTYLAVVVMFATYAATQFKDSLMVRPHPMLWRIIHGVAVVYLLTMVFLAMQTLSNARVLVRLLSPQVIEDFKPLDPFVIPDVRSRLLFLLCKK
jgi:hypothetical protein